MKRCKDCKFYEEAPVFEWCKANVMPDYTDSLGEEHKSCHGTAWSAREDAAKCGPDAKWFEPKYN